MSILAPHTEEGDNAGVDQRELAEEGADFAAEPDKRTPQHDYSNGDGLNGVAFDDLARDGELDDRANDNVAGKDDAADATDRAESRDRISHTIEEGVSSKFIPSAKFVPPTVRTDTSSLGTFLKLARARVGKDALEAKSIDSTGHGTTSQIEKNPNQADTGDKTVETEIVRELHASMQALRKGNLLVVPKHLEVALGLMLKNGASDDDIGQCLINLTEVYTNLADSKNLISTLKKVDEISRSCMHSTKGIKILFGAAAFLARVHHSEARAVFTKALRTAEQLLPHNDPVLEELQSAHVQLVRSNIRSKAQFEALTPAGRAEQAPADRAEQDAITEPALASTEMAKETIESAANSEIQSDPRNYQLNAEAERLDAETHESGSSDLQPDQRNIQLIPTAQRLEAETRLPDGSDTISNREELVTKLNELIYVYLELGDPEAAMQTVERLSLIDERAIASAKGALILSTAGAMFAQNRQFEQAGAAFLKALHIAGETLPLDDPLIGKLNREFIALYKMNPAPREDKRDILAQSSSAQLKPVSLLQRPRIVATGGAQPAADATSSATNLAAVNEPAQQKLQFNFLSIVHSPISALALSLLLIATTVNFLTGLTPQNTPAKQLAKMADLPGSHFSSIDQFNSIDLKSDRECFVHSANHDMKANYTLLTNSEQDLFKALAGSLSKTPVWYRYDKAHLKTDTQLVLYRSDAAELKVVHQMQWYADYAQNQYAKNKIYPANAEICNSSNRSYTFTNVFTGKPEYPPIILYRVKDGDPPIKLAPITRHWRPGAIYCENIDYQSFLVYGFDSNGDILTSSDPAHAFVIVCKNGVNISQCEQSDARTKTQAQEASILNNSSAHAKTIKSNVPSAPSPVPADSPGQRPNEQVRIFICATPDVEAAVTLVSRLIPTLLWLAFTVAGLWCYAAMKKRYASSVRMASIVALAICLLSLVSWYWYVIAS